MSTKPRSEFEQAMSALSRSSVLDDFWYLLRRTGKWWMLPLVLVLVVFGVVMLLGGTAVGPLIYTLF